MHLHILGICGTFMGGLALIARALGHRVTGSDANVYPPMSTQLEAAGIALMPGYAAEHLDPAPDRVIVGNAMKRGLPVVEAMLDRDLPYTSGPQWLAEQGLRGRHVLAVAGTHGKTTTASMLAWILEAAGLKPGFLIGGVPLDFGRSARLGEGPYFVIEADEYDTAFFDKRSKFVHYRPRTLVLNNLEFDHADIFDDLAQIQRQFHHLVRTVPSTGRIIHPRQDAALAEVLAMGCWTPCVSTGIAAAGLPDAADIGSGRPNADGAGGECPDGDWQAELCAADGSTFRLFFQGQPQGLLEWSQIGLHNVQNALSAIAAAQHVGIEPEQAISALARFQGVKRRMELRGIEAGIRVYDDFAHHPTAIASTLAGLRRQVGEARIIAVLEPRSNTMRMGIHGTALAASLEMAERVVIYSPPDLAWDASTALAPLGERLRVCADLDQVLTAATAEVNPGDHLLVMSNGGFGGIHQRILERLRTMAAGG
ncbi:UDP-N-acetylmuramate:L-alanyl-gamma-D-glutamyl-meso-diaminopimelate ligase [Halochromatium salexigens]|uniref:UDP-N-acetylmuramate--L-alanyl-gamma-D-glutamyl-meso-2,6-diaminoheptandioate ligase n=1 Tax=Halochromatium salexigens TaxID=49447 RepID=A0AAJ0UGS2_HALSE|nr:UDP-N-acetylmuramate:L-alanyl-gamma-D-glutamyl-meso-diaminopimelate ligase [Halochromatium salexigens]MBK5931194.1 UDP-N-acetylmuramate:L-alanyl-gamma-D-glutamyl-meso-diaminopimelate ligase [Halochromatium salexigens]